MAGTSGCLGVVLGEGSDRSGSRCVVGECAVRGRLQDRLERGEAVGIDRAADFASIDQMLDGLEASAGRLASAINTPPLDVNGLREEWRSLQADLARIPPKRRPSVWSSIGTGPG